MNSTIKFVLFLIAITVTIPSLSAQDYKSSAESIKNIDDQIESGTIDKKSSTTGQLVFGSSDNYTGSESAFSKKLIKEEEEWLKIRKQIEASKRKVTSEKIAIHTKRVIDTIVIDVPSVTSHHRLSDW